MGAIGRVCVVITAFDAEPTIARAVRSALAQPEVREVIVVDDVSRDGTPAAAAAADDGSRRLKIIRFTENQGPSAARNAAFAAASEPFLAILDADDYFLPGRFAGIEDEGWDFLADNIAFVPEGSAPPAIPAIAAPRHRVLGFAEFIERNISRRGRPRSELGFLKPVIRREALTRLGLAYDEKLRLGEDFILYAAALARGARFLLSERCGYVAEVRPGSLSGRHRTEDLAALAAADQVLAAELERIGAPAADRALLQSHIAALGQKVATRRYLDHKHEAGLLRATLSLATRPAQFTRAVHEIVDGKLRRRIPTALPPVRMLFEPGEFDA